MDTLLIIIGTWLAILALLVARRWWVVRKAPSPPPISDFEKTWPQAK
jgi:hypothetical protein